MTVLGNNKEGTNRYDFVKAAFESSNGKVYLSYECRSVVRT